MSTKIKAAKKISPIVATVSTEIVDVSTPIMDLASLIIPSTPIVVAEEDTDNVAVNFSNVGVKSDMALAVMATLANVTLDESPLTTEESQAIELALAEESTESVESVETSTPIVAVKPARVKKVANATLYRSLFIEEKNKYACQCYNGTEWVVIGKNGWYVDTLESSATWLLKAENDVKSGKMIFSEVRGKITLVAVKA